MTVEQIKKNAKVMLAFTQGNEIQARPLGIQDENAWKDESSPNFDFNLYEYRVKENTESEYRPFENIKECWEEMLKHQPFGWIIDVEPVNSIIPSEYADAGCIVNVGEDFMISLLRCRAVRCSLKYDIASPIFSRIQTTWYKRRCEFNFPQRTSMVANFSINSISEKV